MCMQYEDADVFAHCICHIVTHRCDILCIQESLRPVLKRITLHLRDDNRGHLVCDDGLSFAVANAQ